MAQSTAPPSIEESLDWEFWKGDFPFWKHAVSGSCAGVMEHILLFPLDTIKTRVQAMSSSIVSSASDSTEREYKGGGGFKTNTSFADKLESSSHNFKLSTQSLKTSHQPISSAITSHFPSDTTQSAIINSQGIGLNGPSQTASAPRFYTQIFNQFGFSSYKSGELRTSIRGLVAEGGISRFFRGVTAITYGCIPAHASYFSVYEITKYHLGVGTSGTYSALQSATCGAAATISHDFILTPMDLVKQRLQLGCYTGVFDCMRTVLKNEGASSFFRSMPTTLVMNMPFGAVAVSTNELMKHLLDISSLSSQPYLDSKLAQNQEEESSNSNSIDKPFASDFKKVYTQSYSSSTLFMLYFLCAGIGGGVAGFVSNPLDVIKTRLQTQDIEVQRELAAQTFGNNVRISPTASTKYKSLTSTILTMWQEEKIFGFWRGTTARITLSIPATAVSWGTYECVKYLLTYNSLL